MQVSLGFDWLVVLWNCQAAEAYVSAISEVHAMVKQQGGRAPKKTARLKSILTERRLHIVPDPAR